MANKGHDLRLVRLIAGKEGNKTQTRTLLLASCMFQSIMLNVSLVEFWIHIYNEFCVGFGV